MCSSTPTTRAGSPDSGGYADSPQSIPMPPGKKAIGIEGDALDIRTGQSVTIGESPVYLVDA